MANSKISALTSATTPLAGTETLPVIQSGATKQVSVANLTAGRAVSADSLSLTTALPVASGGTGTTTGFTAGSVVFAGTSGVYSQNNANFFWNNTNARLGIGTAAPSYPLDVVGNIGNNGTLINTASAGGMVTRSIGATTGNTYHRTTNTGGSTLFGNESSAGGSIMVGSSAYSGVVNVTGAYALGFGTTNTERMRITAGGDVNISSGNVVQGTAAKGFDFSANTPLAGKTSTILNWYEEGTWTPNQGAGLTLVGAFSSTGRYTRVGRNVTISGTVTGATSVAVTAAGVITSNLPFTVVTAGHGNATNVAINASAAVICTSTSVTSAAAIAATATITFSATYFV